MDRTEQMRIIDACLKKLTTAPALVTLNELRLKDGSNVEIDSRLAERASTSLHILEEFTTLDMKYLTKDKNEMLSLRTFFNSYMGRQTESYRKGSGKVYNLTYDFIAKDEEHETAYRTVLTRPIMCFMEEYNGDFILHTLFKTEDVQFSAERYDEYALEQARQYMEAQLEEEGSRRGSSASEMDDYEDEEDDYYTDNM